MSEAAFSITYKGEAVEHGSMSVRDLAPALTSLVDLFEAVCQTLNGESVPIDVCVAATSEGSFVVDLSVVTNLLGSVETVVGGFVDAKTMVELVFGTAAGGLSLFGLYKLFKGKRPRNVGTEIELQFGEQTSFRYRRQIVELYENEKIRDAVGNVVRPALKPGIDRIDVRDGNGVPTQSIGKEEAITYQNGGTELRLVTDETQRIAYTLVSISFMPEEPWRLNDGNSVVNAFVEDAAFMRAIHDDEIRLDAAHVLVCSTRVRQYTKANGELATDHVVEEVLEIREQLPLFAGLSLGDRLSMESLPAPELGPADRRSKYTPLRDHLLELGTEGRSSVTLTHAEIEDLIGAALPRSASGQRTMGLWWRNDHTHTQARNGWLAAGWWVESIDRRRERVYFVRR